MTNDSTTPNYVTFDANPFAYTFSPAPKIVQIDPGNDTTPPYIVAISHSLGDAMKFVSKKFGLSGERQMLELNDWMNNWGCNDRALVHYITADAPPHTIMYAMWALADVGYDIGKMMEDYFMP